MKTIFTDKEWIRALGVPPLSKDADSKQSTRLHSSKTPWTRQEHSPYPTAGEIVTPMSGESPFIMFQPASRRCEKRVMIETSPDISQQPNSDNNSVRVE